MSLSQRKTEPSREILSERSNSDRRNKRIHRSVISTFSPRILKHDILTALDDNNMEFERGSLQENNEFISLSF